MNNYLMGFLMQAYNWLSKAGFVTQFLLLLFFRLNWGWQFYTTGQGKLVNHTHVVSFFSSLHLPAPEFTAWFVAFVECLGGLLLMLGLATRPVGLILSINMLVAYLSVEEDKVKLLKFFSDQDSFLHADPFFFLLAALLAFAFGAGPFSLDALFNRLIVKKFDKYQSI